MRGSERADVVFAELLLKHDLGGGAPSQEVRVRVLGAPVELGDHAELGPAEVGVPDAAGGDDDGAAPTQPASAPPAAGPRPAD